MATLIAFITLGPIYRVGWKVVGLSLSLSLLVALVCGFWCEESQIEAHWSQFSWLRVAIVFSVDVALAKPRLMTSRKLEHPPRLRVKAPLFKLPNQLSVSLRWATNKRQCSQPKFALKKKQFLRLTGGVHFNFGYEQNESFIFFLMFWCTRILHACQRRLVDYVRSDWCLCKTSPLGSLQPGLGLHGSQGLVNGFLASLSLVLVIMGFISSSFQSWDDLCRNETIRNRPGWRSRRRSW